MRAFHAVLACTLLFSGCAHQGIKADTAGETLLRAACTAGSGLKEATGSVWLKAKSRESSGQFPANVRAGAAGDLVLEVTNLVGGPEALITIDRKGYRVRRGDGSKGKQGEEQSGSGSWGGIPLRWAPDLFLGRFPCPGERASLAELSVNESKELVAVTRGELGKPAERFVYGYREWAGSPWVEKLRWERRGGPGGAVDLAVDFKFDDPEDQTRSPKKWEAKSDRGEVKVRWKDRQTSDAAGK